MRRGRHPFLLAILILLLLACGATEVRRASPPESTTYVYDYDVEIAQAAQIGEPRLVLRLYDVRDLVTPIRDFAGEEINLTPSGAGGTMRLTQFISPRVILGPAAAYCDEVDLGDVGVDIRGLGGSSGWLAVAVGKPPKTRTTWRRSTLVPNTTRLLVGEKETLPLRAMRATARIHGFRARVLLDFVYENDRDRPLEGSFQVRLPDGASPWYLAFGEAVWTEKGPASADTTGLDLSLASVRAARKSTWTGVREARIVPRDRAARAYGETVRRKVDPALLEWSGAGVFRARVFPLLAGKRHRIVLGYDLDLTEVGDGLEYRLELPADVPDLVVDLAAEDPDAVVSPAPTTVVNGRQRFVNPETRRFRVRLPRRGNQLLHGEDPEIGPTFAARLRPDVPEAPSTPCARAVFLVDVSLSTGRERLAFDVEFLHAILQENRQTIREFAVLFFDVESFWWRRGLTPNTPENARAVRGFANDLLLEGATDLGQALDELARTFPDSGTEPFDAFLLGDGAGTWGETDVDALLAKIRPAAVRSLFAYDVGTAGTDRRTLARLADSTGGALFNLTDDCDLWSAARAHTRRPWRIRDVAIDGGHDLLLEGGPERYYPGQTLTLVGRGRPAGEAVTLTLEQDGRETCVRVPLGRTIESDLAPRAYGEVAVDRLEALGYEAESLARPYATHFRVVGRTCSLLMLESDEDYARFEIRPRDDAAAVRGKTVRALLSEMAERARETLGRARAEILGWLERLERETGSRLSFPEEVRLLAESLPEDRLRVAPDRLVCDVRRRGDLAAADADALKDAPDYGVVAAEADRRLDAHGTDDALAALSSLVEGAPGEPALLLDLGDRALAWERSGQAYRLFARMAHRRPLEPAGHLGMARAAAAAGKTVLAMLHFEVVLGTAWDGRYGEVRRIATLEYVDLLRRAVADGGAPGYAHERLAKLRAELGFEEADLVVTIAWTTDRTDVDLHVVDPTGEVCFYQNRDTNIGGHLTTDVRGGFGPEMFVLEDAMPGIYEIRVKNFATDGQRSSTRTRVLVTVQQDRGRPNARVDRKTLTLSGRGEEIRVAIVRR